MSSFACAVHLITKIWEKQCNTQLFKNALGKTMSMSELYSHEQEFLKCYFEFDGKLINCYGQKEINSETQFENIWSKRRLLDCKYPSKKRVQWNWFSFHVWRTSILFIMNGNFKSGSAWPLSNGFAEWLLEEKSLELKMCLKRRGSSWKIHNCCFETFSNSELRWRINVNTNMNTEMRNFLASIFKHKKLPCDCSAQKRRRNVSQAMATMKTWFMNDFYSFEMSSPRSFLSFMCRGIFETGRFGKDDHLKRKWINFKPHETHLLNPSTNSA